MIGIAADDSMHGDDIGGPDAVADDREVSEHALETVAHVPAVGFASSRVEVCRRSVDKRRRANAIRQEFEVKDADTPANVEQ